MKPIFRMGLMAVMGLACSDGGPSVICSDGSSETSVHVCDNYFVPGVSTIGPNESVTWTWMGVEQHNVTFVISEGSSGDRFNGTHTRTFPDTAGIYYYRCTHHSSGYDAGMIGRVTVVVP